MKTIPSFKLAILSVSLCILAPKLQIQAEDINDHLNVYGNLWASGKVSYGAASAPIVLLRTNPWTSAYFTPDSNRARIVFRANYNGTSGTTVGAVSGELDGGIFGLQNRYAKYFIRDMDGARTELLVDEVLVLTALSNGNVGIGTETPLSTLHVVGDGRFTTGVILGSGVSSTDGAIRWTGSDFQGRKGGSWVSLTASDSFTTGMGGTPTGSYSVALGLSTASQGDYSVAMGRGNIASGEYAFVMGRNTVASGIRAVAFGFESEASGNHAFAVGTSAIATHNNAIAMGHLATASATRAIAMGEGVTASAFHAFAVGLNSEATANRSTAMGHSTTASGVSSMAQGHYVIADSYASVVHGSYNDPFTVNSATTFHAQDMLFQLGNGTGSSNRGNALTVFRNGKTVIHHPDHLASQDHPDHLLVVEGSALITAVPRQGDVFMGAFGLPGDDVPPGS